MTLSTFNVSTIFEKFAAEKNVNLVTQNIDDVCYGMDVSGDTTLDQFLRKHQAAYNYQIVDGNPVRLIRRAVNDDLVIDVEIDESECIRRGDAPAVKLTRIEPSRLPRQVEIQFKNPDLGFAFDRRVARHTAAPLVNTTLSVALDFNISAQQAQDMAFDLLYRLWAQQLQAEFEHPDLRIEPSDILRLMTTRGTFTCFVDKQTINMPARTNTITAPVLLTSKSASIFTVPTGDPETPVGPPSGVLYMIAF